MPSVLHEAFLLLFRNRPTLAPEILEQVLRIPVPAFSEARVEDAVLTELVPTEYRADLVVLLLDGAPVLGIVVEAQLARDAEKRWTWPLYAMGLRARLRCPACVLVVTPDAGVASWAAQAIDTGQPGSPFVPLVLGPGSVPWIREPEEARLAPELAVLSALAHGKEERALEVALAGLAAFAALDPERSRLYFDLVFAAMNAAAQKALEVLMVSGKYEYQSDFAKKYIALGRAEGRAEGKVEALLKVLSGRGLSTSGEQRERILSCTDPTVLDQWIERALVAGHTSEVFEG